jgi:hypothetical protein
MLLTILCLVFGSLTSAYLYGQMKKSKRVQSSSGTAVKTRGSRLRGLAGTQNVRCDTCPKTVNRFSVKYRRWFHQEVDRIGRTPDNPMGSEHPLVAELGHSDLTLCPKCRKEVFDYMIADHEPIATPNRMFWNLIAAKIKEWKEDFHAYFDDNF